MIFESSMVAQKNKAIRIIPMGTIDTDPLVPERIT
jgi:hypothetical protein